MLKADAINSLFYINRCEPQQISILKEANKAEPIIKKSTFYIAYDKLLDFPELHSFAQLDLASLEQFNDIDMLLIGTGQSHKIPSKSLYIDFAKLNYAVDVMNSVAACRTFNILVAEERKVAALIYF